MLASRQCSRWSWVIAEIESAFPFRRFEPNDADERIVHVYGQLNDASAVRMRLRRKFFYAPVDRVVQFEAEITDLWIPGLREPPKLHVLELFAQLNSLDDLHCVDDAKNTL